MPNPSPRAVLNIVGLPGHGLDATTLDAYGADLATMLHPFGEVRLQPAKAQSTPDGARGIVEVLTIVGVIVSIPAGIAQIIQVVQSWLNDHLPRECIVGVDILDESDGRRYHAGPLLPGQIGALTPPSARNEKATMPLHGRHAMVVGIGSYTYPPLTALAGAPTDVQELSRILGDPHVGGFKVVAVTDVGWAELRGRIASFFAERSREDDLLLYLSCHGLRDRSGRLYLASTDTSISALSTTAVPVDFILDEISKTASEHVLLVLDCCFGGAFGRKDPIRVADPIVMPLQGGAVTVLTAASATEYAFEGSELVLGEPRPSLFATAMVKALGTGAADRDGNGLVTTDELFEFVSREVIRESKGRQTPRKWEFNVHRSFVVARVSAAAPTSPDPRRNEPSSSVDATAALPYVAPAGKPSEAATAPPSEEPAAISNLLNLLDRFRDIYRRLLAGTPVSEGERDRWMLDAAKVLGTGVLGMRPLNVPETQELLAAAQMIAKILAERHGIHVAPRLTE